MSCLIKAVLNCEQYCSVEHEWKSLLNLHILNYSIKPSKNPNLHCNFLKKGKNQTF